MKSVCILGLGWLGKQIANSLLNKDFEVYGVNRSYKSNLNFKQWTYDINKPDYSGLKDLRQLEIDLLIITIPPSASDKYADALSEFMNAIYHPNLRIIYTSSTSIYGSEPREITEESKIDPKTTNAIKINAVEQFITNRFSLNWAILRLAGLAGLDRHPIKFLSGRKGVKQPKAAVNLIHAEEIVSFIELLLSDWKSGFFNLCNPHHPTKEVYYPSIARQLGIEEPEFDNSDQELGKQINSVRMKELNFEYKYKNLEDFPLPNFA